MRALRLSLALLLTAPPLCASAQPYVVQPGDTLWGISQKHLQSPLRWPEIRSINNLDDPRRLVPGNTLDIGGQNALVSAVQGRAWRRRGQSASAEMLALQQRIQVGDILETDASSFLTLSLPGGSRTVLPSKSTVEVLAMNATTIRLRLVGGRVESQVSKQRTNQQFEIRARSFGLGVRGTDFRVRDDGGQLIVEVLEGSVGVTGRATGDGGGPGATLVDGGQGMVVAGSAPDRRPRTLLPAPKLLEQSSADTRTLVSLQALQGASGYHVVLARDDRFDSPLLEVTQAAPAIDLPATLDRGFYHLRATAFDKDGVEGAKGDYSVFVARQAPASATLQPDGGVEIRWGGSQADAVFELADNPGFDPVLARLDQARGGVAIGPLAVAGRYFWRARDPGAGSVFAQGMFDIPEKPLAR